MTLSAQHVRPEVLAILAGLLEERVGIHYGSDTVELIRDRMATRSIEAGFDSLLDYYYYLRYDTGSGDELDALIDEIVVGETYFFRELDQMEAMVDRIVEPTVRVHGRARLWSSACSTGEEPLTLAMLLAERKLLDHVEILASDLSRRALARARQGRFGPRSIRQRRPAWASRYLTPTADGHSVEASLVDHIQWQRINLADEKQIARMGFFDLIFCKNVLIYFSDERARRVAEALGRQLTDDGALVLGVSESLIRLRTSLRCDEVGGSFVYRRGRS
jgi:chemotaxis protein methyltransferase CheR